MIDSRLRRLVAGSPHYIEIRYHNRRSRSLGIRKGTPIELTSKHTEGVGIRVLYNGAWGFAATSDLGEAALERSLRSAFEGARRLSQLRRHRSALAETNRLATGVFELPGYSELLSIPLSEHREIVEDAERRLRNSSKSIDTAQCQYTEVFEEKFIVTSDGADVWLRLVRPELRFLAFATDGSKMSRGYDSVGATGGWQCMFQNRSLDRYIETAAASAVDLLTATPPEGGRKKVILAPAMVGLLAHEAIGHTVEADFVISGSVARDLLGQQVASEKVTLCDSGSSEHAPYAGGELPVDDEGVYADRTVLIEKGKLVGYLHSRETAKQFGVKPTGNARAWEFSDEPLIRMRNTYIEPGTDNLNDMIAGIEDGFYVDGPEGGQADATGEFMFGASRVRRIKNGKLAEVVQKVTLSGNAFDVLRSVDAVSSDFKWDLGSGHCGKGQPAKVDAGGPFLRCEILVGGEA